MLCCLLYVGLFWIVYGARRLLGFASKADVLPVSALDWRAYPVCSKATHAKASQGKSS